MRPCEYDDQHKVATFNAAHLRLIESHFVIRSQRLRAFRKMQTNKQHNVEMYTSENEPCAVCVCAFIVGPHTMSD